MTVFVWGCEGVRAVVFNVSNIIVMEMGRVRIRQECHSECRYKFSWFHAEMESSVVVQQAPRTRQATWSAKNESALGTSKCENHQLSQCHRISHATQRQRFHPRPQKSLRSLLRSGATGWNGENRQSGIFLFFCLCEMPTIYVRTPKAPTDVEMDEPSTKNGGAFTIRDDYSSIFFLICFSHPTENDEEMKKNIFHKIFVCTCAGCDSNSSK